MNFRLVPFHKLLFENMLGRWMECVLSARLGNNPVRYRVFIQGVGSPSKNIEIYSDKFFVYSTQARCWNETGNKCSLRVFSFFETEWYVGPYAHEGLGVLWMKLKVSEKCISYFRLYPLSYEPGKEPMPLGYFFDLRNEFSPPICTADVKDA